MSYIDPKLKAQFESLPIELKNAILEKDVQLHSINDLMQCLESIVAEG